MIIISEEVNQKKKSRRRSRKRRRESDGVIGSEEPGINESDHHEDEMSMPKKAKNANSEAEMISERRDDMTLKDPFVELSLPRMKGHRAGFDAFMTGYCFAWYRVELVNSKGTNIEDTKNKVYLAAKDMPLTIMKSHFVKTSSSHKSIMGSLAK